MTTQDNTPSTPPAETKLPAKRGVAYSVREWFARPETAAKITAASYKLIDPERLQTCALALISKTPALQSCSAVSLITAITTLAQMGCEPDGIHGFIVPFRDSCTPIPTARGLMRMARRTGAVQNLLVGAATREEIETGRFLWEIVDGELSVTHRPNLLAADDPHKAIYYVLWQDKAGKNQGVYMTRKEIDSIRSRSRAGNSGPWVDYYDEMAKKTVIKRAAKQWDLPVELIDALRTADDMEFAAPPARPSAPLRPAAPAPVPEPETIDLEPADPA